MDKYHQSNPPTELKSVVMGRENSRKGASSPAPCYRLLETGDVIESDDEFLEDDCQTWRVVRHGFAWNIGKPWHNALKPMRRKADNVKVHSLDTESADTNEDYEIESRKSTDTERVSS